VFERRTVYELPSGRVYDVPIAGAPPKALFHDTALKVSRFHAELADEPGLKTASRTYRW
jgi:hypothetical protein